MTGYNYATNCGDDDRFMYRLKDTICIGCFTGTYDEAKATITKEYTGTGQVEYIAKLDTLMVDRTEAEMLADVTSEDWMVREAVAKYSDKHHTQLKDDEHRSVRRAVAECSDKYHVQLKDDTCSLVREAVADYSDKHHEQLKDDTCRIVRAIVAGYSDKYHEQLKNDKEWLVREAVAKYSDKHHEQIRL